jgi:hypothetical protein
MRITTITVPTLVVLLLLASGCSGDDGATTPTLAGPVNPIPGSLWEPTIPTRGNYALMVSEPGDWLGDGQTEVVPSDSTKSLWVFQDGALVTVLADQWSGLFVPMEAIPRLVKGYYPNTESYTSRTATRAGFGWYGHGKGCTSVAGWFVIDSIVYIGEEIQRIDLRSEQRCNGASASLHSAVHWIRPAAPSANQHSGARSSGG